MTYLREEWLSRVKGDYRFPRFAIDFLQRRSPDLGRRVRAVALHEKPLRNWMSSGLKPALSADNYLAKARQFRGGDIFFENDIKRAIKGAYEVDYCPHHLSHILSANAFLPRVRSSLHVVLDGYGDGLSGLVCQEREGDIVELRRYTPQQSLGLLYSGVTEWAGFAPNEDEYKLMALAAYGCPAHLDLIREQVFRFDDSSGEIWISPEFFNFEDLGLATWRPRFAEVFGAPPPPGQGSSMHERPQIVDVVASFQQALEECVLGLLKYHLGRVGAVERVVLSGGVFHNSKLVGVLSDRLDVPVLVSPTPGDAGSSIGAASFACLCQGGEPLWGLDVFCGPALESLRAFPMLFEVSAAAADATQAFRSLMLSDEIVASFDGCCEVGPRALGARSLFCNARSMAAIQNLNTAMKRREAYRPIAPMIEQGLAHSLFRAKPASLVNASWMGQLIWPRGDMDPRDYPFLHRDLSARAQVVDLRGPRTAGCIPAPVANCLGQGMILANTSFNIAGDPMVFTAEDCYVNCVRMGVQHVLSDHQLYRVLSCD